MPTIYVGNVSKRKNSTHQPTLSTSYDCALKKNTSIVKPTFIISASSFDYNYCKWNNNYYFMTDCVSIANGLWEASFVRDVLATFKSNIQSTSALVLYDTDANSSVADNRLPISPTATYSANTSSIGWTITEYGGRYVAVTGEDSSGVFAVSSGDEQELLDGFLDWYSENESTLFEDVATGLSTMTKNLLGSGNINQCVKSCYAIPITTPNGVLGTRQNIKLGIYDTGITGYPISKPVASTTFTISIPWQATDWRRSAPYHQIYLYLPFIGTLSYPANNLIGISSLSVTYACNFLSGALSVEVKAGSNTIGTYGANIAFPIPIGSSNLDAKQMVTTLLAGAGLAAAGAASGGIGAFAGAAAMAGLSIKGLEPFSNSAGGLGGGSGAALSKVARCYTIFHDTIVTPTAGNSIMGTPTGHVKSLSGINGYVQTINANVAAPATDSELTQLNNMLDNVIYIE